MKSLALLFILIFNNYVYANTVEQYIKTKNGITLFALYSKGSIEELKIQDAFLDRLIEKLKRPDKSIQIYLLTDQFRLFALGRKEWFASIAYDTLRSPDPMFLEDYFYYRMGQDYREYITKYSRPPSNKYQIDLPEPLDLGATYNTRQPLLGLKIIYDYGETDSVTGWNRLYTLVQYAIDNIDAIKSQQKRIALQYPVTYMGETDYSPTVSLMTIDTNEIKNIPLLSFGFDHKKIIGNNNHNKFFLIGSICLVVLIIAFFLKKRNNLSE